jgi:DNA-binding transcriptional ArsR family regulator
MMEQEESAVPEEILRAVPSPYSEREEEEVSEKQPALSPKLQLALTLYQSGKATINDLATAMTAQGKYGKVSASEAYNLLGLLDEMGYITRNRKVKSEG